MILLDKDSIGLYYISRRNLYKLFPYTLLNDFKAKNNPHWVRHKIIKDEVSANIIEISKNFKLDKEGIISNKFRIKRN